MEIPAIKTHQITGSSVFNSVKDRKVTDLIAVHCAATRPGMNTGTTEIHQWHRKNGWAGCGYHFTINRDGLIMTGRPIEKQGAHAPAINSRSVAICLAGGVDDKLQPETNYTDAQYDSLFNLLNYLLVMYELTPADIIGHCDVDAGKPDCPGFPVYDWFVERQQLPTLTLIRNAQEIWREHNKNNR